MPSAGKALFLAKNLGIQFSYSFYKSIHVLDTITRKHKESKTYKNKTQPTVLSISCVITTTTSRLLQFPP